MDSYRNTRSNSVVRRMAAPALPAVAIWLPAVAFALAAMAFALAAAWSPAAAQDRPLDAEFPEVYRVGGLGAPEWAQFTRTGTLAFDGAGNLYHLDSETSRLIVVGQNGELVMTTGRKGEGPGEFFVPTEVVVWRDGRYVVPDLGHGAYQIFGPDGELLQYVRMSTQMGPFAGIEGMRARMRPDPMGAGLFAQGTSRAFDDIFGNLGEVFGLEEGEEEAVTSGVDDHGIERIDLSGDVAAANAVLQGWRVPREEPREDFSLEDILNPARLADQAMGAVGGEMHLEPGFYWDVLPDGTIAYTDSSAYEIKLAEADGGAIVRVLRRPHEPEPVNRRIRSEVIEREIRELERDQEDLEQNDELMAAAAGNELVLGLMSEFGKAAREQIENRPFFPEVSVVRGIQAAWDSALWIQRRGEEVWDDDGPVDVFGADREYLGTYDPSETEMPAAFGPDGLAAFWEFDELDVPRIVVKRLPVEVR